MASLSRTHQQRENALEAKLTAFQAREEELKEKLRTLEGVTASRDADISAIRSLYEGDLVRLREELKRRDAAFADLQRQSR